MSVTLRYVDQTRVFPVEVLNKQAVAALFGVSTLSCLFCKVSVETQYFLKLQGFLCFTAFFKECPLFYYYY